MKKAFIITIATAAICLLSACAAGWHKQGVSDYDTEKKVVTRTSDTLPCSSN